MVRAVVCCMLVTSQILAVAPPVIDRDPPPPQARLRLGTARFHLPEMAYAIALSSDGRTYAITDHGMDILLMDAMTGRIHRRLPLPSQNHDVDVRFADCGRKLIATNDQLGVVVWETVSWQRLQAWEFAEQAGQPAVSDDGKRAAVSPRLVGVGQPVSIRELPPGRVIGHVQPVQNQSVWVSLSPDGSVLATGGRAELDDTDGTDKLCGVVQVWDANTWKERFRIAMPGQSIGAGFSPDSTSVAVVTEKGLVRAWDVAGGRLRWRCDFSKEDSEFHSVRYTDDGSYVCVSSSTGQLIVLDPKSGTVVRKSHGYGGRLGWAGRSAGCGSPGDRGEAGFRGGIRSPTSPFGRGKSIRKPFRLSRSAPTAANCSPLTLKDGWGVGRPGRNA